MNRVTSYLCWVRSRYICASSLEHHHHDGGRSYSVLVLELGQVEIEGSWFEHCHSNYLSK